MDKGIHTEIMIGNYAIARGLVEAGLEIATAYPGTPSSEIIPGIIEFNRREQGNIYTEWSVNEKCAIEAAFGGAYAGRKAACIMKQVGLNVAFPALLKGRNSKLKGALVIISCDDPGPQSSQTEQDTRLLAALFDIPVFEPASPKEACDVAYMALQYSAEKQRPVIFRSTHRINHSREAVPLYPPGKRKVTLHEGTDGAVPLLYNSSDLITARFGIIASGMSYSIASDVIAELGLDELIPVYKIVKLPDTILNIRKDMEFWKENPELYTFIFNKEKILILEETDSVLEVLCDYGDKICGRLNGYIPDAGELTYDVIKNSVQRINADLDIRIKKFTAVPLMEESFQDTEIQAAPPVLCAGCPHRASFFAMKQAFPEAIFPGDIGCYTLGVSQGAVDTCLDMGGGIGMASGFFNAINQDNEKIPIIASVGDSTFFHSCLPPLYDAVQKQKAFILIIMDNGTTAMTGMQPTPHTGIMADNTKGHQVIMENTIKGLGVEYLRIIDPYDIQHMISTIQDAGHYINEKNSGPAVIIARRECILIAENKNRGHFDVTKLEKGCLGCKICMKSFNCPAMLFVEEKNKILIDKNLCIGCGVCIPVCKISRQQKKLQ